MTWSCIGQRIECLENMVVGGVVVELPTLIVLIHVCMYIYGQVYSGRWRGSVACTVGHCNGTGEVSWL